MKKFFKCPVCGKIVEVIEDSAVPIMCCGKPMQEMIANTTDAAVEKHCPVVVKDESQVTVNVGSVTHPMTPEHYISWIHVVTNKKEMHFKLNPNEEASVSFNLEENESIVEVYAYCNLHGLWKC